GGNRTGGPDGDVGGRDHAWLARAGRGNGGAPRARPRLSDEPERVTRPTDDPSGRDPALARDVRGAGEESAGTRRPGDALSDPVVVERDRVARRQLAAGARLRDSSP